MTEEKRIVARAKTLERCMGTGPRAKVEGVMEDTGSDARELQNAMVRREEIVF